MEEALREAVAKSAADYIGRQQAMVAQWVALRPLLEVCSRETVYEGGGGRKQRLWWRQRNTEENLCDTLEDAELGPRFGQREGGGSS